MIRVDIRTVFDYNKAAEELLAIKNNTNMQVVFEDGEAIMASRVLVLHLYYWAVAHKWGMPILSKYVVDTRSIGYGTFGTLGTLILDDIRARHPATYRGVIMDFMEAMNRVSNLSITHCQNHHRSLDIVDLTNIDRDPNVRAITDDKILDTSLSLVDAEKKFKTNVSKLCAILKKPSEYNAIWPFVNLALVSEDQLAHIFYQIGYRTDINDTIIRHPVKGNYLNGLTDYVEYVLEALSAKKSAFYNKEAIPSAAYFGRKQHLLLSCLPYLYPGDCGTKVRLMVDITKKNCSTLLHKNMVIDGHLVTLDKTNVESYIGKQVRMRSPLGCRYTNGVCEICAGKLLGSVAAGVHIGIYAALQTTEKIVQVILSSKHLQRTNSVNYALPTELSTLMLPHKGGIAVQPRAVDKVRKMKIAFNIKDAIRFTNISEIDTSTLSVIDENAFGKVSHLRLMRSDDVPLTDMISFPTENTPKYSKQFIKYVADNPSLCSHQDEFFVVDLCKYNFDHHLFKITSVNLAMANFVKAARTLLEIHICSYTSGAELYKDFTDLVRTQVSVNTVYLELVLRASMMVSDIDIRLPIVEDIDNIKFGANVKLNCKRSLGSLTAFQELPSAVVEPLWYLTPKTYSRFDTFLALKPRIT